MLLSPHAGIDYSFNLDDNEGVCDLFDVQILNYWVLTAPLLFAYTSLWRTFFHLKIAQLGLKCIVVRKSFTHITLDHCLPDDLFVILALCLSQHKTKCLN